MQRIAATKREDANEEVSGMLDAVQQKLGGVPNTFLTMANSPAVLGGYLGLAQTLENGDLPFAVREGVSLVVSNLNGCSYCLSAFTAIGKGAGIDEHELKACRVADSADPKIAAALAVAKDAIKERGAVSDEVLAQARAQGYTDAQILEIVANVALYTFINYVNLTSRTEIDFPLVVPDKQG